MTYSILHLPFLPVRGFHGESDFLILKHKRLREAEAMANDMPALSDYDKYKHDIDRLTATLAEKSHPMDYDRACACARAAMADGD